MDKHIYYLDICKLVASRSSCLKIKYGSVIVKDDRIISTGFNGAASGLPHCEELGGCYRLRHNIPSGTCYETCRSVHAEMNAIIRATYSDMIGSTLYLNSISEPVSIFPCEMCLRAILNSGIASLIVSSSESNFRYKVYTREQLLELADKNKYRDMREEYERSRNTI